MSSAVATNLQARIQLSRQENEQWVLARGAIDGERAICFGRLAIIALIAAGQALVRIGQPNAAAEIDAVRVSSIIIYIAVALAGFLLLGRVKSSNIIKARRLILIAAPIWDFGFAVLMNVRLYQMEHESAAGRLAPFVMVLLLASVLRSNRAHVVYATAIAVASYVGYGLYVGVAPGHGIREIFFVSGTLLGEGAFLFYATGMVRRMMLDFGKIENVSRFLPAKVAKRVREDGEGSLAPATREATVLFSDIRNFTSMSERRAPTEVMSFLTTYFERMQRVVNGHDGVVNKFIGDGMMAVWGVPDADPDHARKAMSAALDMRRVVAELNQERAAKNQPRIQIGIGLHSGPLAAGMLGGEAQHEYTVIGDAVNLTSRIEGLTKQLGADILVSDATWGLAGGKFKGTELGAHQVKGREQSITLHALES